MKYPPTPILLGKPMRKFVWYAHTRRWTMTVGPLRVWVTSRKTPNEGWHSSWHIEGLSRYSFNRRASSEQAAANAAGKVLEQLAKAIRGEK